VANLSVKAAANRTGYFWRRQTLKSNIVNPIERMQKPCGFGKRLSPKLHS